MDDQVFARIDRFIQIAVRRHAAAVRMKRDAVVHLLVEGHTRVGPEEKQCRARLAAVFPGDELVHVVRPILATRRRAAVEDALYVHLGLLLGDEFPIVCEPPVTRLVGQGATDTGKDLGVVARVVDRIDPVTAPDLQERVGARPAALKVLELNPRVGRQHDVGVLGGARPLDLLIDHHVRLWQDVGDDLVDPLRLVEEVGVVVPDDLRRGRQVRRTGEHPFTLRCLHTHDLFAVCPVARLFAGGVVTNVGLGEPGLLVEDRCEGVLQPIDAHARTGPRRCLEDRPLVIARPRMAPGAVGADVAGQRGEKEARPVVQRRVEIMVDPLAEVNRGRLDRRIVLRHSLDERRRGPGDFGCRHRVVVLEVTAIHLEDGHDGDVVTVNCANGELPFQCRIERELLPDLVA